MKSDYLEGEQFAFQLVDELSLMPTTERIVHNQTVGWCKNGSNVTLFGMVNVNITLAMAGWWFISLGHKTRAVI